MNLKQRIYPLFIFCILLIGCSKIPVNWQPTFDSKDAIPYGTYILRQELETLFPDSKITNITKKTSDYFEETQYEYKYDQYIFLYPENFFSDSTWIKIIEYVNKGHVALISTRESSFLEKELKFSIHQLDSLNQDSKVKLSFADGNPQENFILEKGMGTSYFSTWDTINTEILGYLELKKVKKPNFIKIYHGKGYFLLHTEPYAFTNYHMLKKNHYQYVTGVLSYLPDQDILWDNHRIFQREKSRPNRGGFFNALGFMMKHQSLRWALILLMISGFLYLIFNAKRKQKPVPILLPYPNYTLDFAKTLSELYRYNSDHTAMVKYKINYFLDQLRSQYNITSKDIEKDYSELLSAKSGVELSLCQKIVLNIDIFKDKTYLDKEDFFKLQSLIQTFNQKSKQHGRTTQ